MTTITRPYLRYLRIAFSAVCGVVCVLLVVLWWNILHIQKSILGFGIASEPQTWTLRVPYWFTIALLATCGCAPWIPYRFSLRTLLIATTLLALTLGLVIATTR